MRYVKIIFIVFLFVVSGPARADDAPHKNIEGLWLTEKEDVAVRIQECDGGLCGKVAWLAPGEDQFGVKGLPICGAQVLSGFEHDETEAGAWKDGMVLRPDNGESYNANLKLTAVDKLELRAYIVVPALGETKTLTRTAEASHPQCHVPGDYARAAARIKPAAGASKHKLHYND